MLANQQFVNPDHYDSCDFTVPQSGIDKASYEYIDQRHLVTVDRVMYVNVLDINRKWIYLRQILKIEVDPGDDFAFVVFAPAVGIGGTGDTLPDAIRSLSANILSMWEELKDSTPDELHRTAQLRLARLRAVISE